MDKSIKHHLSKQDGIQWKEEKGNMNRRNAFVEDLTMKSGNLRRRKKKEKKKETDGSIP